METIKSNKATLAKLIKDVKTEDQAKINLTDEQLLEVIMKNYNEVDTKSGMLKLIRKDNFKVSQDRCYGMYLRYQMTMKQEKETK